MSHVFPRHRPKLGEPINADDVNEAFRTTIDTVQGHLGEHNWADGAIASRGDMAADVALRAAGTSQAVDWTTFNAANEPASGPVGAHEASSNMQWETEPQTTVTCNTRGGIVWIMASWQMDAGESTSIASYFDRLVGCQFAIKLDGYIVEETIIGGMERANDKRGEALAWDIAPQVIDCVLPLEPGQHTISLAFRQSRNTSWLPMPGAPDRLFYELFNREIIVIEAH